LRLLGGRGGREEEEEEDNEEEEAAAETDFGKRVGTSPVVAVEAVDDDPLVDRARAIPPFCVFCRSNAKSSAARNKASSPSGPGVRAACFGRAICDELDVLKDGPP